MTGSLAVRGFDCGHGAADLLEDRLEQVERREDVLAGERAGAVGAARGERLPDRAMLLGVLRVQPVDRVVARRPDRGPENVRRALFASCSTSGRSATR